MDETLTWLIISVVSLIFSGLFSGTEIAFITSNRVRVELDMKKGGLRSKIINKFYSDPEFFISTILVGNNVVLVIYGMGAAALLEPWIEASISQNDAVVLILQTIISTAVILLTGEFLPKTVFRINPNSSIKYLSIPIWIFYVILFPISKFTSGLSKLLMRMCGIEVKDAKTGMLSVGDLNQYLESTIDDIEEEQKPVENEVKIFHNALDFSSTHLRDCMIPRNEIFAVDIDETSREELSELFTTSGRSKIVVYKEDIDNVLGYIHVSELFDPENDWKECLKPVIFAPESLLANKMMRRLLSEKRSIAIVIDEFGGTAGMVTLEDLVEEIFGDIQDEHDKSGIIEREIAPDQWEFSGRAEIAYLNDKYHLDLPEDDEYQTLAGYILVKTGQIPSENTKINLGDYEFEIIEKSANRLELIRVKAISEEEKEEKD